MLKKTRALTLTQRLFLLTAVALSPAFLILLYNLLTLRDTRLSELHQAAERQGEISALEMDRIVYGSEAVLRAISSARAVREYAEPECSAFLETAQIQLERFAALHVVDNRGTIRCSSEDAASSTSLSGNAYFADAVSSRSFVLGTYTVGPRDGRPLLPMALPIRDGQGHIAQVIVGALDLGWLGERLRDRDLSTGRALTIADRNGMIIAREPFPERFVGTRIPDQFHRLVNAERLGTEEIISQDGTPRIIGYAPVSVPPVGLYVSTGLASANAFASIDRVTLQGLVLAIGGLAVAFAATWATGRALVRRPVHRLLATIRAWRNGDENARTGMSEAEGEIGAVGEAIDGYMDDLIVGRRARREAAAHRELLLRELDHRVKNILATVQAVARQTFREGVDREEAMATYAGRLEAIAKAQALLISTAWRSADIHAVVENATAPFEPKGASPFKIDGPRMVIGPKPALGFSMALHELCTNSLKYGALRHADGQVRIDWSTTDGSDGPVFRMVWREKHGPPVTPPSHKGFGSRMIERQLAAEIRGRIKLAYPQTGVTCTIEAPLDAVVAPPADQVPSSSAGRTGDSPSSGSMVPATSS